MANRPSARRNGRRRRRRGSAAYTFLAVFLVLIVVVLAASMFLRVTHIEVEGVSLYNSETVIEASGIHIGDSLLFLGASKAIQNVFGEFPYFERVSLRRSLPGTIIILVTERKSIGVIEQEGVGWIIDAQGLLLEKTDGLPMDGKPKVLGLRLLLPTAGQSAIVSQDDQSLLSSALALLSTLERRNLLGVVSDIDVRQSFALRIFYDNRFIINLGTATDLDTKLDFLEETLKQLSGGERGWLDLSRAVEHQAYLQPSSNDVPLIWPVTITVTAGDGDVVSPSPDTTDIADSTPPGASDPGHTEPPSGTADPNVTAPVSSINLPPEE